MKKIKITKRLSCKKEIDSISLSQYLLVFVMIAYVFVSCSNETREYEKIEIDVPNSVKEEIKETAPLGEYKFLALKESYPKNIEEMMQSILFTYGEIENQVDLRIIMASQYYYNALLFKATKNYFINPNLSTGSTLMSTQLSLKFENGQTYELPRERFIYGKDHSQDDIISDCLEKMKINNHSILLIKRSIDSELFNQMVEIIFTNR